MIIHKALNPGPFEYEPVYFFLVIPSLFVIVVGVATNNRFVLIVVPLGMVTVSLVCVVLILVAVCACKGKRRRTISGKSHPILVTGKPSNGFSLLEHIQIAPDIANFKLAPPPKGKAKAPTSLPMSVNPIYDGPTYESPGGQSFKALLGGSSVPSTPMSSSTPTCSGDNCRYFDMPPSLPPPRKISASTKPHPLTPGIPEEGEPTAKLMRPTLSPAHMPPNVLPSVYEAMGGEYAYITSK